MKHREALCKNGIKYKPEDIKDIKKLVEMRYYGLTDTNQEFELLAVNAKNPYFRFKHSPGKDFSRKENNPAHTKIKDELLNFLKSAKTLRVYTYGFVKNENKLPIKSALFYLNEETLKHYEWKTEVFKRIGKNGYTLFDICGYSKDIPYPTSAKPNFIFEIIQTSFLKPQVFRHICIDSEINFTICIFIYVPENAINRNDYNFYWNNFEIGDEIFNIRTTHYVDNGFFYENKNQIGHYIDTINENGEKERPSFENNESESEYWDKHYLYIKEKYFKSAVKRLKP